MKHGQSVTNAAIDTLDVLPGRNRVVVDRERAETEVILVEHSGVVQSCIGVDAAVRLDVASHTVHNRGQGLAGTGRICVVVDNVRADNGQVVHWPDALVPVDVASEVSVNVVFEQNWLEGVAHVGLVRGDLRTVHGTMSHSEDPRRRCAVDRCKVLSQPGELLV